MSVRRAFSAALLALASTWTLGCAALSQRAAGHVSTALDPTVAAPGVYEQLAEAGCLRAIRMNLVDSDELHRHERHFVYVESGERLDIISETGEVHHVDAKAGELLYSGPVRGHRLQNLGSVPVVALDVEISCPAPTSEPSDVEDCELMEQGVCVRRLQGFPAQLAAIIDEDRDGLIYVLNGAEGSSLVTASALPLADFPQALAKLPDAAKISVLVFDYPRTLASAD